MKIFIVTRAPFPSGTSTTGRILCYAKGILANGVQCEVVTTSQKESKGTDTAVPFTRICKSIHPSSNKVKKVVSGLMSLFLNYKYLKRNVKKGDVIFVYGDNLFDNFSYWLLAHFHGMILIKELCEIPFLNDKLNNRIRRWFQLHHFFKMFDGFIAISDNLVAYAKRYKSVQAKIIKVPVLFDHELLECVSAKENNKYRYIFHAGGLTEYKDGIHTALTAFGIALPHIKVSVKFVIAGMNRWKYSNELMDIISKYQLEKHMMFLDLLSPQDLVTWGLNSDLAIIYKNDNHQNRNGFATKIADALSCETAIITTTVGEPKNYLKDGHSAYIIEPLGSQVLAEKIIEAFANPNERIEIASNGKKIAEEFFDSVKQGKRLVAFFSEVSTNAK